MLAQCLWGRGNAEAEKPFPLGRRLGTAGRDRSERGWGGPQEDFVVKPMFALANGRSLVEHKERVCRQGSTANIAGMNRAASSSGPFRW